MTIIKNSKSYNLQFSQILLNAEKSFLNEIHYSSIIKSIAPKGKCTGLNLQYSIIKIDETNSSYNEASDLSSVCISYSAFGSLTPNNEHNAHIKYTLITNNTAEQFNPLGFEPSDQLLTYVNILYNKQNTDQEGLLRSYKARLILYN